MHSSALALGWELWARNRLGLALLGGSLAITAVLGQVLPQGQAVRLVGQICAMVSIFVFFYLLSVFVYSTNTLGGKAVGFPPRLFALPVRTSVLVGWPMLYGTTAAALWWLVLEVGILIPCGGVDRDIIWWPAVLLAAVMASFQAVSWTLVRSLLLRLAMAIVVIPSLLLALVLFLQRRNIRLTVEELSLCLGGVIGLSYVVAVAGVARERRGDRLGWAWVGHLAARALPQLPTRSQPFASAQAAQRWLELWRYGWFLPLLTTLFVLMLFWATTLPLDVREVAQVVVAVLTVPVLLGFFAGFAMGKTSLWASDYRLSSFAATRPLSSADLAQSKLVVAALSATATWGLLLLLGPLWAILSGNVDVVRQMVDSIARTHDTWELAVALLAALVGLVGLTWLQMVGGMCLSLTGRPALVNAFALSCITVLVALTTLGLYTASNPDFLDTMLVLAWCLACALWLVKLGLLTWAWSRPGWRERTWPGLLLVWLGVASCLLVPLYLLVPPNPIPNLLVAVLVLLALPLTRLTAVPAAVAWNRHR
jgi:hypothetical protein